VKPDWLPFSFRDDSANQIDTPDHDIASSSIGATSTPSRPHHQIGATSLDSTPATSDDESFRDIEPLAEVIALTDTEKKRQEVIKGKQRNVFD